MDDTQHVYKVMWSAEDQEWMPRNIRRLRASGYWVWDHTCEWIGVRYYQVYTSYDQAHDVHIAHKRICKLDWDEDGWYKAPRDWRAYVSWPVIR